MSFTLALDIGSSSVRAAIYDGNGVRFEESFVKNDRRLEVTEDGGAEIDAEQALGQVIGAIADVSEKVPELIDQVELIATSCFWHSLVGIDESGKALTPVYGWADTRSAKYVATLCRAFNESATHNRTGARFHPSYWTAKLLWLKETKPAVFDDVKYWLSFSDLIAFRFFGKIVTSVSMASGSGIFDFRKCVWDRKLTSYLGVSEKLPRIAGDEETFQLNGRSAVLIPQLAKANWLLAIGDGAANNVGAGCVTNDRAALMIGTSGAMRVCYAGEPPEKLPKGLWCYRIDRKRLLVGGALSDGGGLYGWLRDTLKLVGTDDEIELMIGEIEPDSHGLTFLPFLAGERSTGWHAGAQGAILGLHSASDAIDIARAALESVAYRFAEIFDQLNALFRIETVIASGGALRESPLWSQIIADVLNQKMSLPEVTEASSQGVVNLALEAPSKRTGMSGEVSVKPRVFQPELRKHKIYQQARKRHRAFYDKLVG